jgi:uncharacterized SAM-binding protein YcdF (DUF218 family)
LLDLDVGTRAVLKLFLLPPGLLVLMLAVGWLFARRLFGRLLLLIAIAGFYGLSTPATVHWLAGQLETAQARTFDELRQSQADGILVFLAGSRRQNPEYAGADALSARSLERVDYALAVHRETRLPILLSGGSRDEQRRPVAELAADWLQQRAGLSAAAVDAASQDTWENARNSRVLLEQLGMRRVILVTHAYHMPRAQLSARAAGLDVVPAPFAFIHTPVDRRAPYKATDWLPQTGQLERAYLVLHEMAGLVWYGFARGLGEQPQDLP